MITATFQQKNEQFISYFVVGHANYASHGQDIVCAAVSALYTAVTNAVLQQHGAILDTKGNVHLKRVREAQYIVAILYYNLLEISRQYPNNLQVRII